MPEDFAVDAIEDPIDIIIETSIARPLYVRIARYTSNILAPITVSVPFIMLVALYHARSLLAALGYACATLFFLSFGPMLYILLGVRLGKLSDVDVSRRTERAGPFLFGIISVTVGVFVLMYMHGPKNLETVLISTAVSGVVMMVTTLWWKISIHASSLAGAATMLTALYGAVMLPLFVLVALVSWSRVVLRRHTVAQVVAGSLASTALATAVIMLRGI